MLEMTSAPESLAIFDIDGTLCETSSVDDECFCAVAGELLEISVGLSSWKESPHQTDSGIMNWLWARHRDRTPTEEEIQAFQLRFERALVRELARAPHRFRAVTGAARLVELLSARGWRVAFGTGGWLRTARLKLAAAGLPVELLMASADDSRDRAVIFELAEKRARQLGSRPARVVLVGDALCDVEVASRFSWSFLGRGGGTQGEYLRVESSCPVVDSFNDVEGVARLIHDCGPPPLA